MTNQNNDKSKNGKRIALILVALLLIAAIAFGAYTYSKYVESGRGNGGAEVAEWGFEIKIGDTYEYTDDLGFSKNYSSTGGAVADATGAYIQAKSDATSNVVAPGAHGSTTFTIGGSAEVQAELTATFTGTQIAITITGDGETYTYRPVVYSISGGSDTHVLEATGTIEDINEELATLSATIPVNTEFSDTYTLSWKWAFEAESGITLQPDDGEGNSLSLTKDQVNQLDTILGKIAAGKAVEATDFNISSTKYTVATTATTTESATLTLTVTQSQITNS